MKLFDKLTSLVISLLIPQVIFFMAYFMDKFCYIEMTLPITQYKFFWLLSLVASLVCANYSDDILPHNRDKRSDEDRLGIVWALSIGSIVLFILFGFGHQYIYCHLNDFGMAVNEIGNVIRFEDIEI